MLKLPILVFVLAAAEARGASKTFDFRDPKRVNAVSLSIDSPLEPVTASANGVSGTIELDPTDPKRASGKIVIDAATVEFPNPGFTASARGPDGFEAARFPVIEFSLQQVKNVRVVASSVYAVTIVGDLSCHGVKKRLTIEAEATYLPGKAEERNHSGGDLLVLRSAFKIRRRDFGIKPRVGDNLLGEVVEVRLAITGTSAGS
jgi:polyisoprenoid-binding protein YceI